MANPQVSILENGLTVITVPADTGQPYIEYRVRNGSRHETAETAGIDHFLEHILAGPTETHTAKELSEITDNMRGTTNAGTSHEATTYYYRVAHEFLADAMQMIVDGQTKPLMTEENIENERGSIIREIEMYASDPEEISKLMFYDAVYDGGNLGRDIGGTVADVSRYTAADLKKYMEQYYTTDNAILLVSGRVDHEEICAMAAEKFAELPRKKPEHDYSLQQQSYRGGYKTRNSDEMSDIDFALGFEGPAQQDLKGKAIANLLCSMMANGFSSRLMEELRTKRGLVYSIGAGTVPFTDTGVLYFGTRFSSDNAEEVVGIICDELRAITTNLLTEDELSNTKNTLIGQIERMEGIERIAKSHVGCYVSYGRFLEPGELEEAYASITLEEVQAFAEKVFSSPPTVTAYGKGADKIPPYEEITERLGHKRELDARGFCKDTAPKPNLPLSDAEVIAHPGKSLGREVA